MDSFSKQGKTLPIKSNQMLFEKKPNQPTPSVLHLEWKCAEVAVSVTAEHVMFIPGVTHSASTVN